MFTALEGRLDRLFLLVVVATMGAVLASAAAASAAPPEFGRCVHLLGGNFGNSKCTATAKAGEGKYEWLPGPGASNKFTLTLKPGTKMIGEEARGPFVVCSAGTGSGEVSGPKEVADVVLAYSGCQGEGFACTSAGQTEGTIVMNAESGVLGFESIASEATKDKLALEWHPSGEDVIDFSCGGIPIRVRGSVLHNFKANTFTNKFTEKFARSKAVQKPDHFAGGFSGEHTLESSFGGGGFTRAAFSATFQAVYEEKLEASSVN